MWIFSGIYLMFDLYLLIAVQDRKAFIYDFNKYKDFKTVLCKSILLHIILFTMFAYFMHNQGIVCTFL